MHTAWIDLALIKMGYLLSVDGRWRHIPGLDIIARDALGLGVRMRWGRPDGGRSAFCIWRTGEIVLAPELFEHDGVTVRRVVGHEVTHVIAGPNEESVRRLLERRYGDLLEEL